MPAWMTNIWNSILGGTQASPIATAMEGMVTQSGELVGELVPIGIGIVFVLSIPRIVMRIIRTFV